jgi:hypothetical protein
MIMRFFFIFFCGALIAAQCYLIVGFSIEGNIQKFMDTYRGLGVVVPDYTLLVFRTLRFWWALPTISALLLALALWAKRRALSALAVAVGMTSTVALYWTIFAPAFWNPL